MRLTLPADGNIDFAEFASISNKFPQLFMPAFRLYQEMSMHWMGELFWDNKVHELSVYYYRPNPVEDQRTLDHVCASHFVT